MEYQFAVNEEKVKPHQMTALHLICALTFTGAGAITAIYNYTIPYFGGFVLVCGLLVLGVTMFRNRWLLQPARNQAWRIGESVVAGMMAGVSFYEHWKFPMWIFLVLGACLVFALFWERTAADQLSVWIDDQGIKLPVTARKRYLDWHEVEVVVVRFGTLSINCADDRLFQYTLKGTFADREEIEKYCALQVEANKHKRIADW